MVFLRFLGGVWVLGFGVLGTEIEASGLSLGRALWMFTRGFRRRPLLDITARSLHFTGCPKTKEGDPPTSRTQINPWCESHKFTRTLRWQGRPRHEPLVIPESLHRLLQPRKKLQVKIVKSSR